MNVEIWTDISSQMYLIGQYSVSAGKIIESNLIQDKLNDWNCSSDRILLLENLDPYSNLLQIFVK